MITYLHMLKLQFAALALKNAEERLQRNHEMRPQLELEVARARAALREAQAPFGEGTSVEASA